MFSDDKSILNTIALLKVYNIKNIVISPGVSNSSMCLSVQRDNWFNIYSIIDERSAAYFAVGLARESEQPVVIMCTEATASRNYLSAMTEAYYNHVPIIAITFKKKSYTDSLQPQHVDRRVLQNDVKDISIALPEIHNKNDELECRFLLSMAFSKIYNKLAYVIHIDIFSPASDGFKTIELPKLDQIEYINAERICLGNIYKSLCNCIENKKVALFIGAHNKFSNEDIDNINIFVDKFDALVFCDHASNYTGNHKVSIQNAVKLNHFSDFPDIIIDIGRVPTDYFYEHISGENTKIWRLSDCGTFFRRFRTLNKLFHCSEKMFFNLLAKIAIMGHSQSGYWSNLSSDIKKLTNVDLPLCTTFVAKQLAQCLPENVNIHLGIQNSTRNMNFFQLPVGVKVSCNTGGFGIDGAVSAAVGQAEYDKNKLCFLMLGDLAFFYDMNALRIRHIGNNLRILLINNDGAAQFHISETFRRVSSQELNGFIAASGHNGAARPWVESNGFHYLSARNKVEFMENITHFCDPKPQNKPVLFEVFTDMKDEKSGIAKQYDGQ